MPRSGEPYTSRLDRLGTIVQKRCADVDWLHFSEPDGSGRGTRVEHVASSFRS